VRFVLDAVWLTYDAAGHERLRGEGISCSLGKELPDLSAS